MKEIRCLRVLFDLYLIRWVNLLFGFFWMDNRKVERWKGEIDLGVNLGVR